MAFFEELPGLAQLVGDTGGERGGDLKRPGFRGDAFLEEVGGRVSGWVDELFYVC